jgi:mannosyltransferase OCH1-like enzyme
MHFILIGMEEFETLVKRSYNFNQDTFNNDVSWKVLRQLYVNNYLNAIKNGDKIPKKIHQIWFGEPMSKEYRAYAETWKRFNPDWEYKLWTEKDVNDVDIPRRDLFNSIEHLGQKSDFLRYHILNQFGGLYVDMDFECIKSFNPLSYLDFYIGVGYPSNVELYIGLIASVPHHPVIERVIRKMVKVTGGGWRNVFNTTGTYFFTNNFFRIVTGEDKGIVAFPTEYFYPFPNYKNHHELNGRDYIKDRSYAVHHWGVSWRQKRKVV